VNEYRPQSYWDELLGDEFSERGVAYPHLARSFNQAMYDSLLSSTAGLLDGHGVGAPRRVLDVGAGTGVWIDFWERRGAAEIVGVDITQVSVDTLRARYPSLRFERLDISDQELPELGRFDAISAMSVLLHITDETRFARALRNLAALLERGGALVLIEPLVVHRWWGPPFDAVANSKARPLADWQATLQGAGLRLDALVPATCLLANAVDTRHRATSRLLWRYWDAVGIGVGRRERVGALAGRALLAVDRLAVRHVRPGPSAKLMLVRQAHAR
jgi:SAM-dependent methyltransferase